MTTAALSILMAMNTMPAKDTAIILPVHAPASFGEKADQNLHSLLGRASLTKAFEERGISVLSMAMTTVIKNETGLDFADTSIWDKERFQVMANRWNARYIAAVKLTKLEQEEKPIVSPQGVPAPGVTLNTTLTLTASLWDNKDKKFIEEDKEYTKTYSVGRPGPSEEQLINEKREATMKLAATVFEPYLSKFPKVKKPAGKGGGGEENAAIQL